MKKNYNELFGEISSSLAMMGKDMPDVMKGFGMLVQGATKEGALSKKHKELIALALGVAAHCEGCIAHHTHSLVELGTTRAELLETLGMAVVMGGGPSVMYAMSAIKAFEDFGGK
jgi:AhpD family alkylhydroperoxidase